MLKQKDDETAGVFTKKIEQLLSNTNDWRNIQDIVRSSIKALCDVVNVQSSQIKELEKSMTSKANKADVLGVISEKANMTDITRTINDLNQSISSRPTMEEVQSLIEDKVSRSDLQYFLNSKISMDDMRHLLEKKANSLDVAESLSSFQTQIDYMSKEMNKKINQLPLAKDISKITSQISQKANLIEVNELLASKISKDEFIGQLRQRATKGDIEQLIKGKADIEELNSVALMLRAKANSDDVEMLKNGLSFKADKSLVNTITDVLNSKTEQKELEMFVQVFNEFKKDINTRVNGIDQDFDRFIDNIKSQFQNLNVIVSNIEGSKANVKDTERLMVLIGKKVDNDSLISNVNQIKFDIYESFNEFKKTMNETENNFQKELNMKMGQMNVDCENTFNMSDRNLKIIQEQLNKLQKDIETVGKMSLDTSTQLNYFHANKLNEILSVIHQKNDKKEFNDFVSLIKQEMEKVKHEVTNSKCNYSDLDEVYKSILEKVIEHKDGTKKTIDQLIKNIEYLNTDKLAKREFNDFIQLRIEGLTQEINDKASTKDYEAIQLLCDNINHELMSKVDYVKFDALSSNIKITLDTITKELNQKSSSSEMAMILSTKVDTNDFKKGVTKINEQIKEMLTIDQFTKAQANQNKINQIIHSENSIGRWQWNSGDMRNGYSIPWEEQTINTVPDNFYWEKDKTSLMIAIPGMYHIQVGLFSGVECSSKLLINGEVILMSQATKNSFGEYKNINTCESASININEYIRIPAKARVSVSFDGKSKAHGFLTIKTI